MGDKLRFERLTPKKYKIARVDSTGNLVSEAMASESLHSIKDAAKVLGVGWVELQGMLTTFKHNGTDTVELDPAPEKQPTVFLLRGIQQVTSEGTWFDDIMSALTAECTADDPVVEWGSTDECCILDLDFHKGDKPDESSLRQCADTVRPMPLAWWSSRSGGLHLLYVRCSAGVLSAAELCAIAATKIAARFPAARIELKHSTRQPPGEIIRGGTGDAGGTVSTEATAFQSDYSDWLVGEGFLVGQRYPHTQCPVNPSPRAAGNTEPVVVYEDHIYCFICNADGIRRGSRTPGYFPLSKLAGTVQQSMFKTCVENFTHWGHAKHIVSQVVKQENLAPLVYRAALKQRWGDDPRIPLVFSSAPKTGLIRCDGYWMGDSGRVKTYDERSAVLAGLPVAKYIVGNELHTSAAVIEELASTDDLSPYGYPAIVRVWGIQLTQMQEQTSKLFSVLQRNGNPEFLSTSRRMPEDEAWGMLEELYPGLNRNAVELLVAAKGCTEFRAGLPPMVFLTGPTGAGKTQSIHLAASICGDLVTTVTFATEQDRLRQQVQSAKERGSYAFFDEYLKHARMKHIEPDQAMEFVLNLTPDSSSHKLYVGPVCMGELPVCVFADTAIPSEVIAHSQIARRMHHVPLRDSKQWTKATKDLRQEEEGHYCNAADSLLSYIMDRWFLPPGPTDFGDVAKALGFFLFNSSEATAYKERTIRTFFDLVCSAPPAEKKLLGFTPLQDREGWKLIDPHGTGELVECWQSLADAGKPTSRALSETDLRRVLGLPCYVECQLHGVKGGRVLVRFTNERKDTHNEMLKCV